MWIVGLLLIAVAVGLFIAHRSQQDKLMAIKDVKTMQASDLKQLAGEVAGEMGPGFFNQVTEVKGTIVCDHPLTSELAQTPCVYYSMTVTHEYEEDYWDTDANGNKEQKTRTGRDTVASNSRRVDFYVEDSTGRIKVDPDGADLDTEKALSKFERAGGASLRMGSFSFQAQGLTGNRRSIGYRYEEEVIPVGRSVYVLGEATDRSGEVSLVKPNKGKFIISLKSEEELIQGTQSAILWTKIGAIMCAVTGFGLLIASPFVK